MVENCQLWQTIKNICILQSLIFAINHVYIWWDEVLKIKVKTPNHLKIDDKLLS